MEGWSWVEDALSVALGLPLTASEAAIFESLVVTRYLPAFALPAVDMLLPLEGARVAQLASRTGYPAVAIGLRLPGSLLHGVDCSHPAIELARTKASLLGGITAEYFYAERLPTALVSEQYTHALAIHPLGVRGYYEHVFTELHRLLVPGGQAIVSLPLRGSFPELYDMLREYALKHDRPDLGEAVDAAAAGRPNPERLSEQLERVGFSDVELGVELVTVAFEHGRDYLDDPIQRLVVAPDLHASLAIEASVDEAMDYATHAIGKYWSEIPFELTVNIGTVSARKL